MKFFEYIHDESVWIARVGHFQIMVAWQNENMGRGEMNWKEVSLTWA